MSITKIRVMIVDDSVFFREFMSRSLSADPAIEIVGLASNALEAQQKITELKPDVITLDMEMPKMRGTEFLRSICPRYPNIHVVVISSNPNNVFEALQAGAVDFAAKPNAQARIDNATFTRDIIGKIKVAALGTKRTMQAPLPPRSATPPVPKPVAGIQAAANLLDAVPATIQVRNPKAVIAIGASTGGTEAILSVVKDFPATTPGVVIVQHMPPVFTKMYAERLDKVCKMKVREAQDGDRLEKGLILIAAGDKHMRLRADANGYYVKCDAGEKVSGHCPSVDVLFESVAKTAGANAVGVILTGMGADGAMQMAAMKRAGAYTIGQDQETCVVYGMPMMAFKMGGITEQLPLQKIPAAIIRQITK